MGFHCQGTGSCEQLCIDQVLPGLWTAARVLISQPLRESLVLRWCWALVLDNVVAGAGPGMLDWTLDTHFAPTWLHPCLERREAVMQPPTSHSLVAIRAVSFGLVWAPVHTCCAPAALAAVQGPLTCTRAGGDTRPRPEGAKPQCAAGPRAK